MTKQNEGCPVFADEILRRTALWSVPFFIAISAVGAGAQTTPPIGVAPLPIPGPYTGSSTPIIESSVPGIPALSSRPGARYTVYLDFGGFSFTGNWANNASYTPGVTPAYGTDGNPNAFSASEIANIQNIWSRVSEKYTEFNVNVTTVDPAVAAGQAGSDLARQNYYDNTPDMMHTVIGGSDTWYPNAGGVSYVGVTPYSETGSNGLHTNWIFSAEAPTNLQFVGEAAAHENGHGFGLLHQSDYSGSTLINEYSGGNSLYAPTMGDSYSAQRGLWAQGTSHQNSSGPTIQTDVQVIANDPNMGGFINDGIGHTRLTATALPLSAGSIDFTNAKGTIVPASSASPVPLGAANYTADWWSFSTSGGQVTINAISGRSTINPGVADPGMTLHTVLDLYGSSGNLVADVHTSNLNETFSGILSGGSYFAEISPAADASESSYTTRSFFDEGDYFLTGSIPAVPEPAAISIGLLVVGGLVVHRRRFLFAPRRNQSARV
ncbi:MAG: hypothetical protein ABSH08_03345 [Tepidisphaeraceae bacterium]|jgi:hypothetical protein